MNFNEVYKTDEHSTKSREEAPIKVKCPNCGYDMPITYSPDAAICQGIFVRCKARHCKTAFEIKLGTK